MPVINSIPSCDIRANAMKFCWANTVFILMILILGTLSALSACGQKGDLYLPEKDRPVEKK